MTITQTVDIPADRHLRFDVKIPHEISADKAQVIIQFPVREEPKTDNNGFCSEVSGKIPRITRKEIDEMVINSKTLHSISGILSSLGDIDLDEYRMKRLAKHL